MYGASTRQPASTHPSPSTPTLNRRYRTYPRCRGTSRTQREGQPWAQSGYWSWRVQPLGRCPLAAAGFSPSVATCKSSTLSGAGYYLLCKAWRQPQLTLVQAIHPPDVPHRPASASPPGLSPADRERCHSTGILPESKSAPTLVALLVAGRSSRPLHLHHRLPLMMGPQKTLLASPLGSCPEPPMQVASGLMLTV